MDRPGHPPDLRYYSRLKDTVIREPTQKLRFMLMDNVDFTYRRSRCR